MFALLRLIVTIVDLIHKSVFWVVRQILRAFDIYMYLPRALRYVITPVIIYCLFAISLVYVYAPIRGWAGKQLHEEEYLYASERWLGTALYDANDGFVGTFDPRLDSERDFNFTGRPITLAGASYVAPPDHKSIPTLKVPPHYWSCLKYQEDRHIGGVFNPFGIDLMGVLKIPYTTVTRSFSDGRVRLGVGGSTLSMQLVRAYYKLTPHRGEGVGGKLGRKFTEWWYAPVVYQVLSPNGDLEPFKLWASNHLPLAQRTGGQPLYGVEATARVVFGKSAEDLTIAEQYVLAAAVNHPIILLHGSEKLNKVRLSAWRQITKGRAHQCAVALMENDSEKISVITALDSMGDGPPDPKVAPVIADALSGLGPEYARWAGANPVIRANLLTPAARYGARRELENQFGYGWRNHVRSVQLSLDVKQNLAFRGKIQEALPELQAKYQADINPGYSLDAESVRGSKGKDISVPDIIVAAANEKGEIVRYYESRDTASYFGSWSARDRASGKYDRTAEPRAIASIGKMMAAIAIANQGRDTLNSTYVDTAAPARGLESCVRNGSLRRGRRAEVAFACSLSNPLERRMAQIGQRTSQKLIDGFRFNMPAASDPTTATPPSTAIVRGFVTGSAQRVHQMASVVLASFTGRGRQSVAPPSLLKRMDARTEAEAAAGEHAAIDVEEEEVADAIIPNDVINARTRSRLKSFLSTPLCYSFRGQRIGTLKSLGDWCAQRRKDVRVHFAKTGTQVTLDPDSIVDVWVAGGIQFSNGKSFSYVVLVGTGNSNQPWASRVHAAQIAAPLAGVLLKDLRQSAYGKIARAPHRKISQVARK